ncbi:MULTISPECIES: GNAT family N-acetyltransferase [Qipengyuania]|uniref:GNAT family N-acetyltransferase n=1 Tax=Qipengyuania soli TaxID=2782568 RepID=A0A7S8F448_9SPHN|nr:GNAT family N-acetyltransferase [Qipengyuania soli]QPD00116.1 GNAT family N-acetyltransferase [Qipengyuania soli]
MTAQHVSIRTVHPSQPEVSALLDLHLHAARTGTKAGYSFALDHSALAKPGITLFGVYAGDELVALGALSELGNDELEVKSMRVAPGNVGKGYGRLILDHLIAEARKRGAVTMRLETGTTPDYVPANGLYSSAGFIPTGPFAQYAASDHNRFYALTL